MDKAYEIWRGLQDAILARIAGVLLLGSTLLALLEIFRRYVLGVSFDWQQDAVTLFILCGVFLFFGIAQRHDEHLNVAVLTETLDSLGPGARRASGIFRLVALVFSFAFMVAVVCWGVPEVHESFAFESKSESLAFPMWPFLAALIAGFAFMAVTMFFQIYRSIQKLRGRTVAEESHEIAAAE